MRLFKGLSIAIATTLASTVSAVATPSSQIELTYQASQIQCGANAPQMVIGVDVYQNGQAIAEDMRVGDSVMVSSLDNITMEYSIVANGGNCTSLASPTEMHVVEPSDIPSLPGYGDQDSIATLLSQLESYEDLYLVELGTTNTSSTAYDLQDVVFIVNNNPTSPSVTPTPPISFAD